MIVSFLESKKIYHGLYFSFGVLDGSEEISIRIQIGSHY